MPFDENMHKYPKNIVNENVMNYDIKKEEVKEEVDENVQQQSEYQSQHDDDINNIKNDIKQDDDPADINLFEEPEEDKDDVNICFDFLLFLGPCTI